MVKRYQAYLLSLLSGGLLCLAWPEIGSLTPLVFLAFVPLLMVEDWVSKSRNEGNNRQLFTYSYLTFFTWNMGSTWWIYYASGPGMVMAVAFNALFMAIVFQFFHFTKCKIGAKEGYLGLLFYWIAFEWWHMEWELTWPWLTLGNIFANTTKWIQWYEFTGMLGGSIWIWVLNILSFFAIRSAIQNSRFQAAIPGAVLVLVLFLGPMLFSQYLYSSYEEVENPVEVVAIQPNIDPYNEKFNGVPAKVQVKRMLDLAAEAIGPETDYVIGPETALPKALNEAILTQSPEYQSLDSFLQANLGVNMLIGMTSFHFYFDAEPDQKPSPTSRKNQDEEWYDVYNTALHIDGKGERELYYKSKLVPGVERLPYPGVFGLLDDMAIDLGGTVGSVGTQDYREVFKSANNKITIAPVICYESIFGDYVADYVREGASVIFIITNDGWWDSSPGYRQHLAYARLRTIETRRSIARSANTGTSCFINQRGDVSQATEWWVPAVIKAKINANNSMTFYVRYGEYLARTAVMVSFLLLLLTFVRAVQNRKSKKS